MANDLIESMLDKSVNIVREKDLAKKVPSFSLTSTMLTIKKAMNMRSYCSDKRLDDIHINV